MKTKPSVFILLSLALVIASCSKDDNDSPGIDPKTIELTAKAGEVISGNNDFGVKLFVESAKQENSNLMLSPLSASAALTMLLNGSDAQTYTQIRDMLGYDSQLTIQEINEAYKSLVGQLLQADRKVTLGIANAAFYRNEFNIKQPYLNGLSNNFDAHVKGLNFSDPGSVNVINKWAADNTNQKIKKVIDEISPDAVLFLLNALYFKGDWTYQFNKSATSDKPFWITPTSSKQVKTMTGEISGRVTNANGHTAVELFYGRANFSMVIIIPEGNLQELYNDLTPEFWYGITASLDALGGEGKINMNMPRFKFEYEQILNSTLKSLGMNDAFEPHLANLSGIADASLFVSFVKQNTFVEVNEEGTEAAAVTTIGVELTSVNPNAPVPIYVDKPFVFAIRERTTNTLMFMGKVVDPS